MEPNPPEFDQENFASSFEDLHDQFEGVRYQATVTLGEEGKPIREQADTLYGQLVDSAATAIRGSSPEKKPEVLAFVRANLKARKKTGTDVAGNPAFAADYMGFSDSEYVDFLEKVTLKITENRKTSKVLDRNPAQL